MSIFLSLHGPCDIISFVLTMTVHARVEFSTVNHFQIRHKFKIKRITYFTQGSLKGKCETFFSKIIFLKVFLGLWRQADMKRRSGLRQLESV